MLRQGLPVERLTSRQVDGGLFYCLHTIKVTTATNTMNALELVRRQMLRQMAIKEARLVQLTYRGNTYVKQQTQLTPCENQLSLLVS